MENKVTLTSLTDVIRGLATQLQDAIKDNAQLREEIEKGALRWNLVRWVRELDKQLKEMDSCPFCHTEGGQHDGMCVAASIESWLYEWGAFWAYRA